MYCSTYAGGTQKTTANLQRSAHPRVLVKDLSLGHHKGCQLSVGRAWQRPPCCGVHTHLRAGGGPMAVGLRVGVPASTLAQSQRGARTHGTGRGAHPNETWRRAQTHNRDP